MKSASWAPEERQDRLARPPRPDGYATMKPCSSATAFQPLMSLCWTGQPPAPFMLMTRGVGRPGS